MYKFLFKRIIDFTCSIVLIILLLPIFLPIIIILKLTGEGEVFYFQERIGYKNKKFKIFKFATMLKNSSKMGTGSLTLRNDPRVLPFGKFLRKTKINELPQIFNVLNGSMSLVGPRPQMEVDFLVYQDKIRLEIYDSVPGVTGIGSVFFRDEELYISNSNNPHKFYKEEIAPVKGELEIWYLNNMSFIVDLKLLVVTFWVVIFPKSKLLNKWFANVPKIKW